MKICLLSLNATHFATRRLVEEAKVKGLKIDLINPKELRLSWPSPRLDQFDLTINRISSVDMNEFMASVCELPLWGRQVNRWSLRQRIIDKSRQSFWLAENHLPSIPFFTHRGAIDQEDPSWIHFKNQLPQSSNGWVLKMNRGQRGVGVHFFKLESELFHWLETLYRMGDQDFIIQPWLKVMSEYRVTILNKSVWAILIRSSSDGARANFAQNGEALECLDPPKDLSRIIDTLLAIKEVEALALDVLQTAEGFFISDVNAVFGFEQLEAVTKRNYAADFIDFCRNLNSS